MEGSPWVVWVAEQVEENRELPCVLEAGVHLGDPGTLPLTTHWGGEDRVEQ